ncbi:MAG: DNA-binding protein [Desulfurococcales archaeon]|nr:DNA-binding protein [Desulfurococcales archaeon]MEB3759949.1 DNA-binding protein [Desulfurococcales archaeon]MEB3766042.1 DNA-binding protein [Desulfurococcales archaeon]MEB3788562.1 DNA-binding protein [Desulfurococcales archaeon]
MSYDDKELEELRMRKLMELRKQLEAEEQRKKLEAEMEARRQAVLRGILTEKARERLANLKLVKPELAKAAEDAIIQLVQVGRLVPPVTDEQVKALLLELDSRTRRSFQIKFKRK